MVDNINTQLQNQNSSHNFDPALIPQICHPELSTAACQIRINDYLSNVPQSSATQSQSQVISVAPVAGAGGGAPDWETPVTVGVTITTILSVIVLGVKISYRFIPEPDPQPKWDGLPRKFAPTPGEDQNPQQHQLPQSDTPPYPSQSGAYPYQPGVPTQLGAIPTDASTANPFTAPAGDDAPTPDPFAGQSNANDPADLIASLDQDGNIRNWFICGVPGSGKGTLMSVAVSKFMAKFPSVEFWLIDPKNDPAEDHYWSFVPKSRQLRFDANHPLLNPDQMADGIKSFATKFYSSTTRPRILIVDELPAIAAVSPKNFGSWFRTFLSNVASMGRSRQYGAWISTQAVGVGDNGLTVTAKSCYYQIYLANAQTYHKIVNHPSFQRGGLNTDIPHQLMANNGRVYLTDVDNQWGQTPHYNVGQSPTTPVAVAGDAYAYNAAQSAADRVNTHVDNLQPPTPMGDMPDFNPLAEFLYSHPDLLPITQSDLGGKYSRTLRQLHDTLGTGGWFTYLHAAAQNGAISLNWPYVDLPKF